MSAASVGFIVALLIPAVILGWRAWRDRARWRLYAQVWCWVALAATGVFIAHLHHLI
jgi:hypothetical protein